MGLFDWVNCDYPLPGNPEIKLDRGDEGMQTKCLTNGMDVYRITADGRLLFEKYGEWWEDKTGQYIDFTGELDFYDRGLGNWFYATFDAGNLQNIITREEWYKKQEWYDVPLTVEALNDFVETTLPLHFKSKFPPHQEA